MKPAVGVALFAVIFICSGASAQKRQGRCPAREATFGICSFDPNVNCLGDNDCRGGQICCPSGCNNECQNPENDGGSNQPQQPGQGQPGQGMLEIRQCPQSSGFAGICSFDESVNCLSNDQCKNGQLCCSEGCNKVCKDPVTFQPLKPEPKGVANKKGWTQTQQH